MNQYCPAGDFTSTRYSQGIFLPPYVYEYKTNFIPVMFTETIHLSDRLNSVDFANNQTIQK